MGKKLIIAIDGPSGAGKSTVSKILAERLHYTYIDTGAMYRVVALNAQEENIDIHDKDRLSKMCSQTDITFLQANGCFRVLLNGKDVTEAIRVPHISLLASAVSSKQVVRDSLLTLQRRMGENGGVIMEGRDIGTVVFPEADLKFYLDALPEERGQRRYRELVDKGEKVALNKVTQEIKRRDYNDSTRENAPLKLAADAIYIDSSGRTIGEIIEQFLAIIRRLERRQEIN